MEMADIRNLKIKSLNYRIEELKIPLGYYGSVIVALVLML